MGWKYRSDDNSIEIIVDPDFQGDIGTLASMRPVWIVDSPHNGPAIDAVSADGPERNLFEVSRCPYLDKDNRIGNLLDILGCLDEHHPHHNIVVHGLHADDVRAKLEAECFRVTGLTLDGFVAIQDTEARDRLIGQAWTVQPLYGCFRKCGLSTRTPSSQ
jgi:hypothetical protein